MPYDPGWRPGGVGGQRITPALIEYHKAHAHALQAEAFAAAGRWLIRKITHPFAGVTPGIDPLPFVNGR
jgi:hypothetical protein